MRDNTLRMYGPNKWTRQLEQIGFVLDISYSTDVAKRCLSGALYAGSSLSFLFVYFENKVLMSIYKIKLASVHSINL